MASLASKPWLGWGPNPGYVPGTTRLLLGPRIIGSFGVQPEGPPNHPNVRPHNSRVVEKMSGLLTGRAEELLQHRLGTDTFDDLSSPLGPGRVTLALLYWISTARRERSPCWWYRRNNRFFHL